MAEFILLLHQDPGFKTNLAGPEELQAVLKRYKDWRDKLGQSGHLKGGHKLVDGTGRVMRSGNGSLSVTDGPFAEAKEVLGGLFILIAENYEEAVAIAGDCPHLDYGTIEIRQIDRV